MAPVVTLLALGVLAAVGARFARLSPIVGYLVLGAALGAGGSSLLTQSTAVQVLAELGVVFLLFDIGLNFSVKHVRAQARDIFGLGPMQMVAGTIVLGGIAWMAGLDPMIAFVVGATLALSSTAVIMRLVAERRQQNCPVGLTATAVSIFQDLAAIFLLIVASALADEASLVPALGMAVVKAAGAFLVALVLARVVVRPLFDLLAQTRNEEVFTATALLVALAAAWASGSIGLSLTLGAFLGGMIIAETPYRALIQSEIKPFRGLLLGFFFISVGLSLDLQVLAEQWPLVLAIALSLLIVKALSNIAASLLFRWSVPGSVQLGFLLAQGSEFAFVVLSLPEVRERLGAASSAVLIAAVALSLAAAPSFAHAGRWLAGRLRRRAEGAALAELRPRTESTAVVVVGLGPAGRTVCDGLAHFDVRHAAFEYDEARLRDAVADGYPAHFGDASDPRLWDPMALEGVRFIVLTEPVLSRSEELGPMVRARFPNLRRIAVVDSAAAARGFEAAGLQAVVERSVPPGLDTARELLSALGVRGEPLAAWMRQQQQRALADAEALRERAAELA